MFLIWYVARSLDLAVGEAVSAENDGMADCGLGAGVRGDVVAALATGVVFVQFGKAGTGQSDHLMVRIEFCLKRGQAV